MIQYNVYKDGKKCIVTFSYDDGTHYDRRLVEIFNKYGIKGTFHLNSGFMKFDKNRIQPEEVKELYAGHEVSCHTMFHPTIAEANSASCVLDVIEDRRNLERLCGYAVRGMSYPNGSYSDDVIKLMRACGIVYSRTTVPGNFKMPEDFMLWNPTCHHKQAMEKAKEFMNNIVETGWRRGLLYIWGHSYELAGDEENNSFEYMEKLCEYIGGDDRIWYATNIEIYDYVMAQRSLIITVDENIITNPTTIDVWIDKDGKIIKIPAGETVVL